MLTNPYSHSLNSAEGDYKLQVDVTGEDKALLKSIMPDKGTMQLIVSNLIFNLCQELRTIHHINGYRPDATNILSILLEPRPLNAGQLDRLRTTSAADSEFCRRAPVGTAEKVSEGVYQFGGGTAVCKGLTDDASQPRLDAGSTKQRSHRARSTEPKKKTGDSGKTKSHNG